MKANTNVKFKDREANFFDLSKKCHSIKNALSIHRQSW